MNFLRFPLFSFSLKRMRPTEGRTLNSGFQLSLPTRARRLVGIEASEYSESRQTHQPARPADFLQIHSRNLRITRLVAVLAPPPGLSPAASVSRTAPVPSAPLR